MTTPRRYWAVRGATTVDRDDPALITEAVSELLSRIEDANGITSDRVVSALFTMTGDLNSAFPARVARHHGWTDVPMLCAVEIPVPGSLQRCIRALIHVEFEEPRTEVTHAYLREAHDLRERT